MSANFKKAGRIGTKIVAAFLFLVLVMFNVEVGLYDGEASGNGILGLTMSVFVPDAVASGKVTCSDIGCDGNASCTEGTTDQGQCWARCVGGGYIFCDTDDQPGENTI